MVATRYMSLIRSLRYLVNTRTNLTHVVWIVSRHMEHRTLSIERQ